MSPAARDAGLSPRQIIGAAGAASIGSRTPVETPSTRRSSAAAFRTQAGAFVAQ